MLRRIDKQCTSKASHQCLLELDATLVFGFASLWGTLASVRSAIVIDVVSNLYCESALLDGICVCSMHAAALLYKWRSHRGNSLLGYPTHPPAVLEAVGAAVLTTVLFSRDLGTYRPHVLLSGLFQVRS